MAAGKKAGRKSQQANDFLAPKAPTIGTATNVGTGRAYNNGAATVTFTADPTYTADSFTVTSTPGSYTASAASSPITVTGLQSNTAYTFTVTATNAYGTSEASTASNSITSTTVPNKPGTPTASSPNANEDQISWAAPENGGSVITNYYWESNDSKSGNSGTSTSASLGQEAGTSQAYRVYATNANGNSVFSDYSNTITTTFSFAPFGVFGFSPFSVFSFVPFSVFSFTPFKVFGFSPFSFTPFKVFGFSPFRVFGFSPTIRCIDQDTLILTVSGWKKAQDIRIEDSLLLQTFDNKPIVDTVEKLKEWKVKDLNNFKIIESRIEDIIITPVKRTVIINKDINKRISDSEEILIYRNKEYLFCTSTKLIVGDYLVTNINGLEFRYLLESFEIIEEDRTVYSYKFKDIGFINASGITTHPEYYPEYL
jgi:hypothetical protein